LALKAGRDIALQRCITYNLWLASVLIAFALGAFIAAAVIGAVV
jgi:hypothetical protein